MTKRRIKTAENGSERRIVPSRQSRDVAIKKIGSRSGDDVDTDVLALIRELAAMIDAARTQVSVTENAALVMLHWQIGYRVRRDVLEERRAEYGEQIVATVSRQLEER